MKTHHFNAIWTLLRKYSYLFSILVISFITMFCNDIIIPENDTNGIKINTNTERSIDTSLNEFFITDTIKLSIELSVPKYIDSLYYEILLDTSNNYSISKYKKITDTLITDKNLIRGKNSFQLSIDTPGTVKFMAYAYSSFSGDVKDSLILHFLKDSSSNTPPVITLKPYRNYASPSIPCSLRIVTINKEKWQTVTLFSIPDSSTDSIFFIGDSLGIWKPVSSDTTGQKILRIIATDNSIVQKSSVDSVTITFIPDTTTLLPPENVRIIKFIQDSVLLIWDMDSLADGYSVLRSKTLLFNTVDTFFTTTPMFGIQTDSLYFYRVTSNNLFGSSEPGKAIHAAKVIHSQHQIGFDAVESIASEDSSAHTISISVSSEAKLPIRVYLSTSGWHSDSAKISLDDAIVIIESGKKNCDINFTINNDDEANAPETLMVFIDSVSSGIITNNSLHIILIDNDTYSVETDSLPPEIILLSPEKDSTVVNSSSVVITVVAVDPSGIITLNAFQNETELYVSSKDSAYSFTLSGLEKGKYTTAMIVAVDASDNRNSDTIRVAVYYQESPKPDLTISSIAMIPENPTSSDTITFSVTVKNAGLAMAGASKLAVRVGGETTPMLIDIPELGAGNTHVATRKESLFAAQGYVISATADAEQVISESDETNNTREQTVTVTQADLSVSSFVMYPKSPTTRDIITFTVTIINKGKGRAHASQTAIQIGSERQVLLPTPALNSGESTSVSYSVSLKNPINYDASAEADSDKRVSESDESNNSSHRLDFNVNIAMIANYPLKFDASDSLGRHTSMKLVKTPFVSGGISCNGIYGYNSGGSSAITPNINSFKFNSFSIVAEFKIDEYPERDMPVFVGGRGYRWMGFILNPDGIISLKYNNSNIKEGTVRCEPGSWHEAKITYNGTTGACYLDDVHILSQNFTINHGNEPNISITDFSRGHTFKGTFRNLRVYNSDSAGSLITHYPLMSNAEEASGRLRAMTIKNAPFVTSGNGIICRGKYRVNSAMTPKLADLDFDNLAIKFRFYLFELPRGKRPVIVGGHLYRWLGFIVEPSGKINLLYNNSKYESGTLSCSINSWHEGEITYNSSTRQGRVYLDGVLSASSTFDLNHGNDRKVMISNYSNGTTFKGILSNLKIYSK